MKRAGYLLILCLFLLMAGCAREQYIQPKTEADTPVLHDVTGRQNMPETQDAILEYAFTTLTAEEDRLLYREILDVLNGLSESVLLSSRDEAQIGKVFHCVLADHPELFYVDGYHTQIYQRGDDILKILFSGCYTADAAGVEELTERIETAVSGWLSGMDHGWNEYEKAKYLYETVICNTEYEIGAADAQNIQSVFLNGASVCQGYAKAFQLLCQRAGISSVTVSGSVDGVGHAWNLVCLDGDWYHIDPTWGDVSWRRASEDRTEPFVRSDINYDYFCVTTEDIMRTHQPEEKFVWPLCTAVGNQYYRREGLYLAAYDAEQIRSAFERAQEEGKESITFQCSDDHVYQQVYNKMIKEQAVFGFLQDNRISYADSAEHRTLTFWLSE